MEEKTIELRDEDLLNGVEVATLITALMNFNERHKEEADEQEKEGKNLIFGKYYFETVINHGLLHKLRKIANKEAIEANEQLKNCKL